jgi:hypothetical protein
MRKRLVVFVLAAVTVAYANDTKVSPDLQKVTTPSATVVVQHNQPPSLLDLQFLLGLAGSILNGLPLVADCQYTGALQPGEPEVHQPGPPLQTEPDERSAGGERVCGVAIIDSGVINHPDLKGGLFGGSRVVCVEPELRSGNNQCQ